MSSCALKRSHLCWDNETELWRWALMNVFTLQEKREKWELAFNLTKYHGKRKNVSLITGSWVLRTGVLCWFLSALNKYLHCTGKYVFVWKEFPIYSFQLQKKSKTVNKCDCYCVSWCLVFTALISMCTNKALCQWCRGLIKDTLSNTSYLVLAARLALANPDRSAG